MRKREGGRLVDVQLDRYCRMVERFLSSLKIVRFHSFSTSWCLLGPCLGPRLENGDPVSCLII